MNGRRRTHPGVAALAASRLPGTALGLSARRISTTPASADSRRCRLANEGAVRDVKQPPGALLTTKEVDLRLLGQTFDLPAPDPAFTQQVNGILAGSMDAYGVAVLDLTDLAKPRYAEHRGDTSRTSAASASSSSCWRCSRRSRTPTRTTSKRAAACCGTPP